MLEEFTARGWFDDLAAVGHRVVHGGERFSSSVLVKQDTLVERIARFLEPGVKVTSHIRLANHPNGLGPSSGAPRYRFYMQNGKVTNVEPLDRTPQTAERVGEIQRALQRNRLLSDKGTIINLAPGGQDDTLKKIVFPR